MIRIFRHYVSLFSILLSLTEFSFFYYFLTNYFEIGFEFSRYANVIVLCLSLICVFSLSSLGLYNRELISERKMMLTRLLVGLLVILVMLLVVNEFFDSVTDERVYLPMMMFSSHFFIFLLFLVCFRLVYFYIFGSLVFKRHILVIGAGKHAQHIRKLLEKSHQQGIHILGYVALDDEKIAVSKDLVLAHFQRQSIDVPILYDLIKKGKIHEIVIATDDRRDLHLLPFLYLKLKGYLITDFFRFIEVEKGKVEIDQLSPGWFIFSGGFRMSLLQDLLKRGLDICVSLSLLILSAPILLVVYLLIKHGSPGNPIFSQERVGLEGKKFKVYKFRSMHIDAETKSGPKWAEENDPRITPIGHVIRKLRIDELPQIFNVLKGDMSFVGPRPERPYFVEDLNKKIPYYYERHMVKPGVTGWAQINYPYGASLEDAKEKLSYDLYYVKNRSIFLDLVILFQTVRVVLWPQGVR